MRSILFSLLALVVTACGVQRPLIAPKDIPAYEEKQRKKQERIDQERRENAAKAAAQKAASEKAAAAPEEAQ